mgnify:CR=1 FL=1
MWGTWGSWAVWLDVDKRGSVECRSLVRGGVWIVVEISTSVVAHASPGVCVDCCWNAHQCGVHKPSPEVCVVCI